MLKPTAMNKFTNSIYNNYAKDCSKLLVHIGTACTVIAAGSQVGMLMRDKKLEPKTKKFLVNQEIMVNGVCIALYYSMCEGVRVAANKIVEKGKLLSESAALAIANLKQNTTNPKDWKNTFSKDELSNGISKVLDNIKESGLYKNTADSGKSNLAKSAKDALTKFQGFKNGVGVLAVTVASVAAANFIGPAVGNYIAAKASKHSKK